MAENIEIDNISSIILGKHRLNAIVRSSKSLNENVMFNPYIRQST